MNFYRNAPPCRRHDRPSEYTDDRVLSVWAYINGLLALSPNELEFIQRSVTELYDHKGELTVTSNVELPITFKLLFINAWDSVGEPNIKFEVV